VPPKPAKWITDVTWLNLVELSKLHGFGDILNQVRIKRNVALWLILLLLKLRNYYMLSYSSCRDSNGNIDNDDDDDF